MRYSSLRCDLRGCPSLSGVQRQLEMSQAFHEWACESACTGLCVCVGGGTQMSHELAHRS